MTKPKPTEQQKEAFAKLAKLTAKDFNLPIDKVAQIYMKHPVSEKGHEAAMKEVGEYRAKLTIEVLKKNRLW